MQTQGDTQKQSSTKEEWVALVKISGSGKKNSESFQTSGGDIKLAYKFACDNKAICMYNNFELTVTDKNEEVWNSPDVQVRTESETSEAFVQKPSGKYFVHVEPTNVKYEVEVFEKQLQQ